GKADRFSDTAFAELPFCVPNVPLSGVALPVQGLDGWPINGPPRRVRYQVDQLETALNLAARGQGVLLCPPFVIERFNELVRDQFRLDALPYPKGMKPIKMGIYLVKRKSTQVNRDIKLLTQAIRHCCA